MASTQTFFTLRYKEKQVQQRLILASSLSRAELVGKKFCAQQPGRVFISVDTAVVADESILGEPTPANLPDAAAPPVKPTAEEQRDAHEKNAAARRAGEPIPGSTIAGFVPGTATELPPADPGAASAPRSRQQAAR